MKKHPIKAIFVSAGALAGLVTCGGPQSPSDTAAAPAAYPIVEIAPTDFALVPCANVSSEAFCAILAAGGKRIVIGAPAGIGDGRVPGEETLPDAVLLTSLHPLDIEGVDELRNRTWSAGRRVPLKVAGGLGTGDFVESLNSAYTFPDAKAFLDMPGDSRDFAAMPIEAVEIRSGDIAFDTGDLVIKAREAGNGRIAFLATYDGDDVLLVPCGGRLEDSLADAETIWIMACASDAEVLGADMKWPSDEAIFVGGMDEE
ncbi:MAG: hypothetical protein AAF498_09460 [Pseudomonadota bacterium]